MTARRAARDAGAASIELIALVPALLAVALLVFQVGVAAWTATSTSEAAREAARASSLGRDAAAAAEAALPRALDVQSVSTFGPGHGVRITVRVPTVAGLPSFSFTRSAVMP